MFYTDPSMRFFVIIKQHKTSLVFYDVCGGVVKVLSWLLFNDISYQLM